MSTEIQVDDETRAALLLFNERIEKAAADERAAKRVAKAERAKDEAAARVRTLGSDPKASADDKAAAEAKYKAAAEEYNRIKENPHAPPARDKAPVEPTEAAVDEPTEAAADEPTEVSADEEPEAPPALADEAD